MNKRFCSHFLFFFKSKVVSQLANLNDTVSFHTTNVLFINHQTLESDRVALPDGKVIVLSARPAVRLSAALPELEDCPLTSPLPQSAASPLHSNCLHYCICSQIKC